MIVVEKSLYWFQAQTTQRKISLLVSLLLIISFTLAFSWWALSPSYGVLFNQLDPRDANQLLTQLEQAKIPYQVRHQGREILIDKQLIDKTRLKLMGSDLALSQRVGFELFDKTDFGMTDFSQKINFQRALQGELERTISSLDEVSGVRIHLVIPENHLFQQSNDVPRVGVTLHLNHTLTLQQVKSIQQLITASVANLSSDNVVIVDQNGNQLTVGQEDSASNHLAAKKQVEHYLTEKVMQMLQPVFPDQGVLVKIDATLNYDELQRELDKPNKEGLITHEKETQHAVSNKADKKPINQDVTREKTYQFGNEKERFVRASGTLERITISVVLPKTADQQQIGQVERLVKSIVGFDALRGDSLSVEALIEESKPETSIPMPDMQLAVMNRIEWPNQRVIYLSAGVAILLGVISWLPYRLRQRRRRQALLTELNQWLIEHG